MKRKYYSNHYRFPNDETKKKLFNNIILAMGVTSSILAGVTIVSIMKIDSIPTFRIRNLSTMEQDIELRAKCPLTRIVNATGGKPLNHPPPSPASD